MQGAKHNFQKIVKIATGPDLGFLYITFGLKVKYTKTTTSQNLKQKKK